jgi:hypothetical protein
MIDFHWQSWQLAHDTHGGILYFTLSMFHGYGGNEEIICTLYWMWCAFVKAHIFGV